MTKEECFKNFHNLVFGIANNFFVRKHLQNSENNSGFNMRPSFWGPVITNFQKEFLLELTNMFDIKDDRVFTVYYYLEFLSPKQKDKYKQELQGPKYKSIIKNLKAWRSNYLAHRNKDFLGNYEELAKKFPMKNGEVEMLLLYLVRIMNTTKKTFNKKDVTYYIKSYSTFRERIEKDTDFVLKNGLNTPGYNAIKNGIH